MKAGPGLSSASNEGGLRLRRPAVMGIHFAHLAAKFPSRRDQAHCIPESSPACGRAHRGRVPGVWLSLWAQLGAQRPGFLRRSNPFPSEAIESSPEISRKRWRGREKQVSQSVSEPVLGTSFVPVGGC